MITRTSPNPVRLTEDNSGKVFHKSGKSIPLNVGNFRFPIKGNDEWLVSASERKYLIL
jgi:hypothetical protein